MRARMRIPTADLRAQHAPLRAELEETFRRLLESSAFIHGPEVEAFEREFAAYCGVHHAVAVGNGTDALALALRALGVGPGDVVAVPAFTFAATAEAVCHAGARPLFVDIDAHTFTLDPEALQRTLRRQAQPVRAVIAVHLYGQAAAMDDIGAVARATGAIVVEDAAQAHGARYRTRRSGGLGAAGGFSFYPTKNLGALGDGGAVTTDDAAVAARVALLRDHGQSGKYVHEVVGFNSRLDGLQAAVLRLKLRLLDGWNARRRVLAELYRCGLADLPGVVLPVARPDCEHVYHLFVVRCRDRDALQRHLAARGIGSAVHYALPVHLQRAFADVGAIPEPCPAAAVAAREVLALPLYPELDEAAVEEVCGAVREWALGASRCGSPNDVGRA